MRSKKYWLDEVIVLLGGRLAKEIVFGDVTTGASNDIERATAIARRMVMEWGMSDKVGPLHLSGNDGTRFSWAEITLNLPTILMNMLNS